MEYLRRKIDAFLDEWFNSKNKKPLIIKGARQIGKTKTVEEFAIRNNLSLVEINFVLNPEYRDIFDGTQDYYYDSGLLYREEVIPLNSVRSEGNWEPQIYNPGTYTSKLRLVLTPTADIQDGTFSITNESVGDMSVISLKNLQKDDELIIDWNTNTYTKNGEDYSENIFGDIMYLQPRNYVEKIDGVSINYSGDNTYVKFNAEQRRVRKDDIGKTVMFKNSSNPGVQAGAGGKIIEILPEDNSFKLDIAAGKWTNNNATVIITALDNLRSEISGLGEAELNIEWQVEPRYL
jgi:hypothetical protein